MTSEKNVELGIYSALGVNKDPKFIDWANNWLSGVDRTEESAIEVAVMLGAKADWAAMLADRTNSKWTKASRWVAAMVEEMAAATAAATAAAMLSASVEKDAIKKWAEWAAEKSRLNVLLDKRPVESRTK